MHSFHFCAHSVLITLNFNGIALFTILFRYAAFNSTPACPTLFVIVADLAQPSGRSSSESSDENDKWQPIFVAVTEREFR